MSNNSSEYTLSMLLWLPGEWWYYAAALQAHQLDIRIAFIGKPEGNAITFNVISTEHGQAIERGTLKLEGTKGHTNAVMLYTGEAGREFWQSVSERLRAMGAVVRMYRQSALGEQFTDIIDEYYARHDNDGVTLKALAQAAGVKYDSLRQAKTRYDAKRRKNVSE